MTTLKRPQWRYKEILRDLGTAGDIVFALGLEGYAPPKEDTVQGWRNRNSVPGRWVPVLIKLAIDAGLIADLDDLKPRKRHVKRPTKRPPAVPAG